VFVYPCACFISEIIDDESVHFKSCQENQIVVRISPTLHLIQNQNP
jgi:hypothetical protein